jgi:hypothetical protein
MAQQIAMRPGKGGVSCALTHHLIYYLAVKRERMTVVNLFGRRAREEMPKCLQNAGFCIISRKEGRAGLYFLVAGKDIKPLYELEYNRHKASLKDTPEGKALLSLFPHFTMSPFSTAAHEEATTLFLNERVSIPSEIYDGFVQCLKTDGFRWNIKSTNFKRLFPLLDLSKQGEEYFKSQVA